MTKQFQYTRLDYQADAVRSIADAFTDVRFYPPLRTEMNPHFRLDDAANTIASNILRIRAANAVSAGEVAVQGATVADVARPPLPTTRYTQLNPPVQPAPVDEPPSKTLSLDVLMETGTGKTFTFIETMFKLHQQHKLAKFIILVPSNAIRQGTLKSLKTTAAFFAKEYNNEKINVYSYSNRTVQGFIHNSAAGISVLVATYQSFNKDKNTINQRGVEANLFSRAKSYMEALAAIRPVLIIDEPHRFEGRQTVEYLAKFNPLFTLRFGATFKGEYTNLIYTLDSLAAFRQKLVKSISVDTVGTADGDAYALCYAQCSGKTGERVAQIDYKTLDGKHARAALPSKGNLGEVTGIAYLNAYVVETITTKEVLFTNGFSLALSEDSSYGMLADDIQRLIVARSVANHFEREEALYKRGIKALSLFFIDAVYKYMPENAAAGNKARPAVVRDWFEAAYRSELATTLGKTDLDPAYRAYLERSAASIADVHKGYFARSHSEKGEEEAIKLILEEKEQLLSFDTDLRFIFSMWALQEGWDNPNIFTLCKLAPSNSKITKLQQIGRGLRLAVNQDLERVQSDDAQFDAINELVVIVPATEGDFVEAIQNEIAAHSVDGISSAFDFSIMEQLGITTGSRAQGRLLDALASMGVLTDDEISPVLIIDKQRYLLLRSAIRSAADALLNVNAAALMAYMDSVFEGYRGRITHKINKPKLLDKLTVNPSQYAKFKDLWNNLNRDAVVRYELDTPTLIDNITAQIERSFDVLPQVMGVTTSKHIENVHRVESNRKSYEVAPYSVYTLGEFVRELANATKLSLHTTAQVLQRMSTDKFSQIAKNETRALAVLKDVFIQCIYALIINKVTYQIREVKVKTALTDATGALLDSISAAAFGNELHLIDNPTIVAKSLFNEAFMPVHSQAERDTVNESIEDEITVFAKLPNIKIPTPMGEYNPDFGYVLVRGDEQALYLVVETKGYDTASAIGKKEQYKIDSAKRFFTALKAQGINAHFKTKINQESLAHIVRSLQDASP